MSVLQSEVFETFCAIDIPQDKALRAAEASASATLMWASIRSELLLLKWMMGFVLAFQVAILARRFLHWEDKGPCRHGPIVKLTIEERRSHFARWRGECSAVSMTRRRRSNGSFGGFLLLIVFGAIVAGIGAMVTYVQDNPQIVSSGVGIVVVIFIVITVAKRHRQRREEDAARTYLEKQQSLRLLAAQQRRDMLLSKFGDEIVVTAIVRQEVWHDMTKEQLLESWGMPEAIDTKVMKTKVRETYKYDQTGVNRYARKAVLENDLVVGWQQ